jgi:hypothetical protein
MNSHFSRKRGHDVGLTQLSCDILIGLPRFRELEHAVLYRDKGKPRLSASYHT